jgi:hypothetical protein
VKGINLDLAAESANNTYEVVVKEDDDGSKAGFMVVGTTSEQFAKAKREMDIAGVRFARNRRGVGKIDWKGSEGDEIIADQKSEANRIIARNCVVDWFGFVVGKGDEVKPLEFTPGNLEKVLNLFPAFSDRIAAEVQSEENFMQS